jgi:hypothetical protein
MKRASLRVVSKRPPEPPRPDLYDYEAEQRRRIRQTDWAKVHIEGDQPSRVVQFVRRSIHRVIGSGTRTERGGFKREERP